MFQYSNKRKKVKYFRLGATVFFMIKNDENSKLTSIFDFKRKLNGRMTHGPLCIQGSMDLKTLACSLTLAECSKVEETI